MKKKFFIGLFIFAAIGLFIFAHLVLKHNKEEYTSQTNLNAPIEIPDPSITIGYDKNQVEKPIVALFYVDWCTYCRRFMPIFGEFAQKYQNDYSFIVVNCDYPENRALADEYHVMAYPSLFIIDNQINHKFTLNMAAMAEKSVMQEELENYLKVRKNIIK